MSEKKSGKKNAAQNDVVDGVVIRRPEWARPAPPAKPLPDTPAVAAAAPEKAEPKTPAPKTAAAKTSAPKLAEPKAAAPKNVEPDTVEIEHLPAQRPATASEQPATTSLTVASSATKGTGPQTEPAMKADTIVTSPTGDAPHRWLRLPRAGAAAAAVAICLLGGAAWTLAGNGDDDARLRDSAAGQAELPMVVLGDPSVPKGSSSSVDSPSADSSGTVAGLPSDTASSADARGNTVSRDQQRTDPATTGATTQQRSTTTQPGTSSSTSGSSSSTSSGSSSSSSSSSSAPSSGSSSSSPSDPSSSPSSSPTEPGDDQGDGSPSQSPPPSSPTCVLPVLCR